MKKTLEDTRYMTNRISHGDALPGRPLFGILMGGAVTRLSALQGGSLRKIMVFCSKQLIGCENH
jgi:hypothetical protein